MTTLDPKGTRQDRPAGKPPGSDALIWVTVRGQAYLLVMFMFEVAHDPSPHLTSSAGKLAGALKPMRGAH